ncbi:tail length determinator [Oceanimonas sp. GK1]|uniref:phage tail tape measure protein n=1 Tax=Oceanimonas sp. (strain GK1 / IBRC-M 10197) TaxID=511062 RepID=UPI000249537C|nr:phage tail tape measure protein [Oceanimonas sp. GK1]AEY01475.1 tail length determinator [Oceanimonas sp. GK1]
MKHLEQLMLTVSLVDKVTRPIQGINQQIRDTGELGRQSMDNLIGGAAGLAASGVALYQALMPAIEMDRALGEVKSLGVVQQDLDKLSQTATEFSIEFGKSATEFVGAAYDIKSAMGDLTGDELAGITKSSAVLAAATKADTATVTAYMGTMYGVFKKQADAMGRDNFAAMVAGQTAQAVESFKTTGAEMSAAFGSIGAAGTAAGIAMHEQMAVLGTLQATMSGSEAGTKYKAFLAGIAGAQDKLNMSFVDGNGNMLGMVQILQKLKDKFGDTFTVAESDALKKAFGSDEAVALIKQMIPDVDGLAASIDNVGQQTGMDKATQMAGAMTDQWERLEQVWFALRAGAGASVLPTINGIVGSIVDAMAVLVTWTDMFPHLTEVVTWAVIGLASLTAVAASWTLISAIGTGIAVFFAGGLKLLLSPLGLIKTAMLALRTPLLGLLMMIKVNLAGVLLAGAGIVAVIALIGAVALAVYKYWEPIKAFVSGFIAGFIEAAGLGELFAPFVNLFRVFAGLLGLIGGLVADLFGWFMELISPVKSTTEQLDSVAEAGRTIGDVFGTIFRAITFPLRVAGQLVQWLLEGLNKIPGIDIDLGGVDMALPETPELPPVTQQIERTAGELPREATATPEMMATPREFAGSMAPLPADVPQVTQNVERNLAPLPAEVVPATQTVTRAYQDGSNVTIPAATQMVNRRYSGEAEVQAMPTPPHFTDAPAVKSDQLMAGINERLRTARTPESVQAPPSPLMPQLAKVASQNNGKTVHFGDVHIKNEQGMDPHTLAEWEELQHGF